MKNQLFNIINKIILILLVPVSVFAAVDKSSYSQEDIWDQVLDFEWVSSDVSPRINIPNSKASINLEDFYYVDILENYRQVQQLMYWSNGIEYPRTTHYLDIYLSDQDYYVVNVEKFIGDGYIKGDDWSQVDPDDFLEELKSASVENNKERLKNGYNTVQDISWHIKPEFNKDLGYVYYSLIVTFDDGSETFNSTAMVLGREGYTDLTFVFNESIAHLMPNEIDKVVQNFDYNSGVQYSDFKAGDKVAAYGVGALVAGSLGIKGLAKTGALAVIAAFAKKLWFIILLPFIFLFRLFTGGHKKEN